MKLILFTWTSPAGEARWAAMSREERAADIWPGLDYPGHVVEVVPTGATTA